MVMDKPRIIEELDSVIQETEFYSDKFVSDRLRTIRNELVSMWKTKEIEV